MIEPIKSSQGERCATREKIPSDGTVIYPKIDQRGQNKKRHEEQDRDAFYFGLEVPNFEKKKNLKISHLQMSWGWPAAGFNSNSKASNDRNINLSEATNHKRDQIPRKPDEQCHHQYRQI